MQWVSAHARQSGCASTRTCSSLPRRPDPAPSAITGAEHAAIRLPEFLDSAFTASAAAEKWRELIFERPAAALDFSDVRFIDSSGLGFVFSIVRQMDMRGLKIMFTGMGPEVRHVFQMTKTWDLIKSRISDTSLAVQAQPSPAFVWWLVTVDRACAVLELSGIFDAAQAGALQLDEIQHAAGERNIVVNLKELSFCDSSGIAFLLKLQRSQTMRGRRLVLCNAGPVVQQMLKVTRLERVIACAASLAEAHALLSGGHEQMRGAV